MAAVLCIVAASSAALIFLVFFKPTLTIKGRTFSIYWAAPLLGALVLVLGGFLSVGEVWAGLTADTSVNPLKILVLFLSMTLISIFLDCAGFFQRLASGVLSAAKSSQRVLFFTLYATVSVLTVFTSNDIIVLTFTPFICYFAHRAKIDPLPYLIGEFIAANTWSMLLMIGNPTNIYLATSAGADFFGYTRIMALPTVLAGGAGLAALAVLFRRPLSLPLSATGGTEQAKDKICVALGLVHLAVCILALMASGWLGLPMWLLAFGCCVSLFVWAFASLSLRRRNFSIIVQSVRRAPWEIVPFILSMFVLVLALDKYGVTGAIASVLGQGNVLLRCGAASFLAANLVNNIPMSVLFSSIVAGLTGPARTAALYAAVAGSNIGAFFTPIGALAGIMWTGLLRAHGVKLGFGRFVRYGTVLAVPAMAGALLGLAVVLG